MDPHLPHNPDHPNHHHHRVPALVHLDPTTVCPIVGLVPLLGSLTVRLKNPIASTPQPA